MLSIGPEYRALFAVDIEKSAGRGDPAQLDTRKVLEDVLVASLADAGIRWADCHNSDQGDGFRVVLPRHTSIALVLEPTARVLARRLRQHNRTADPRRRIRLRMAVHAGTVHIDDGRLGGGSLEDLARLLEAPPLREVLAAAPSTATVAVAVSHHVWTDVVRHDYDGIDPASYREVEYTVKETSGTAWLHLPDHFFGPDMPAPDEHRPDRTPAAETETRVVNLARDRARVGEQIGSIGTRIDHVKGDVHIGGQAADPDDLHRQLAELRRELAAARAEGRIDQDSHDAAAEELEAADTALSRPGRAGFLVALRKLKGLVEDVAALASRVATLIDAVRGR